MKDPEDRSQDPALDEDAFDDAAVDDAAFDDPAHDEVRRLLADVRVSDPVPPEVAARLDATLETLRQRSRDEEPAPAVVVPLRRRMARVLVAAAALVVVGSGGVGIAQLARNGSGADNSAADSAGSRAESEAGSGSSGPVGNVPNSALTGKAAKALPRLTTATFARDVSRTMRTTYAAAIGSLDIRSPVPQADEPKQQTDTTGQVAPAAPPVTATPELTDSLLSRDYASSEKCTGPVAPDAVIVPATLDGALVALVFRPPADDAQVVEAWSCDGATLLASATVPN